jgi:hypothetical protein
LIVVAAALRFGHFEFPADLSGKRIRSFDVSRHGLNAAVLRIAPKLVFLALALQETAIPPKMPQ